MAKVSNIIENFPNLVSLVYGPAGLDIKGLSTPEQPKENTLIYVYQQKSLEKCLKLKKTALVLTEEFAQQIGPPASSLTVLKSPELHVAMALINQKFFPRPYYTQGFDGVQRHPTAVVSDSAQVGNNVILGPHCIIHENVILEDNVIIGAGSVIEADTLIGKGSHIHAQVYIGPDCLLGKDNIIQPQTSVGSEGYGYAHAKDGLHHRKPHYGRVILGDRVHLGSGVFIDRGTFGNTILGDDVKIDNFCHLAHNVQIGKGCIIAAGLIMAGSSKFGKYCIVGGRSTINGHIEICDKTTVSALSGVESSITEPGVYGGFPIQKLRDSLKTLTSSVHLPNMRKNIQKIMKHLGLEKGQM